MKKLNTDENIKLEMPVLDKDLGFKDKEVISHGPIKSLDFSARIRRVKESINLQPIEITERKNKFSK